MVLSILLDDHEILASIIFFKKIGDQLQNIWGVVTVSSEEKK